MKVKSLSLAICSILFMPIAHAAPLSFQEAWDLLQQQNNSLAAQRANVERYAHLKDATQNLNLPSVSVGANFTRLDQDVTLSGKQIFDSTGQELPALPPTLAQLVAGIGSIQSTITERDIFHFLDPCDLANFYWRTNYSCARCRCR